MNSLYTKTEFDEAKGQDLLLLQCVQCEKIFKKTKRAIQRVLSPTSRCSETMDYCSSKCLGISNRTRIKCICKQCSKKFLKFPNQIKKSKNHFCSHSCAATYNNIHRKTGTRISKLEIWLQEQLPSLYPNLMFHFNRKDTINSELDIYIPSLKLAFELNGIFHYEPIFGKDKLSSIQNNDCRKMLACAEHNIELCVIDVNTMKNFKEQKAIQFLTIIQNIIDGKLILK